MDNFNAAITAPSIPDLMQWIRPHEAPVVMQLSNSDFAGWTAPKPWEAPLPVFKKSAPAVEVDQVELALNGLLQLKPNWDGHEGVVPTPDAVNDAKQFYRLLSSAMRPPAIEPSGDGEVNLVWRAPGKYLEIGFSGDGALSYYGKLGDNEILADFNALPATLPKQLRIALTAMLDG